MTAEEGAAGIGVTRSPGMLWDYVPGLALVLAVACAALGIAALEARLLGHPVIEGLVLAIVIGAVTRTVWSPPAATQTGVNLSAKQVLEVAVLLLGASVDLPVLLRAGPTLGIGIVALVVLGIALSYALSRALRLPRTLAILIACGNAICGNSAIAAVAPMIDADQDQVVSAIAFTAILGLIVVLGLPALIGPLHLSFYQYGVLTGLTVYAVPQVLAASFPVSALSGQVATLVKLARVLMLGPVVLFFALRQRRLRAAFHDGSAGVPRQAGDATTRFRITQYVPWFVVGFLMLAALRTVDAIPQRMIEPTRIISSWLTVIAMAALGLGCDLRAIARAGSRILLATSGSLLILLLLSVGLIHLLGIR